MSFRLAEAVEELQRLDGVRELQVVTALTDSEKAEKRAERHAVAALSRERLKERLWSENENELGNKLAVCGLPMKLSCTHCGHGKMAETRCKKRWCPACQWSIQRTRMVRFGGAIRMMKWPLFVTLTQPNSDDPECVRELRANWSKMRRRKLLADKIRGGVASIEVTNKGKGWHPHLHAIVDCRWLGIHTPEPTWRDSPGVRKQKCEHAQMELSSIWGSVIKSETAVVWVERVVNDSRLNYILKYSVKGSELLECKEKIGPIIKVMEKSRLVSAFGELHGRTSEMDDEDRPCLECVECKTSHSYMPDEVLMRMAGRVSGFSGPSMIYKK